jgi:molybdopterin/thiamine biosynthesis adenylyltransferase
MMPQSIYSRLHEHLFPGDNDEHGAIITAGVATNDTGTRLLARGLHLARDGIDYVPGKRGYRMLKADFIGPRIQECRDQGLAYLAIHNHGGHSCVSFSSDDLRSHERGYPALLDITKGQPVGALVFAENAIAGDIWLPGERRIELAGASVVGASLLRLSSVPITRPAGRNTMYDRQARLFGDAGQDILANIRVGIIGLGGAGSLLAEYLGRLGVGNFVLADPDRVEISNLPRLTAATRGDALTWFTNERWPRWITRTAMRFARPKVALARRNILRANPLADVESFFDDFVEPEIAAKFVNCDYLFLAADSMRARLLFNAIVHQFLIPGVQVGAKVRVDPKSGEILDAYSVVRPVTPDSGCLLCNHLINAAKLQDEGISDTERKVQRYVDEPDVIAPSVVTLNAVATSHAANDFLFYITGLQERNISATYLRVQPMGRRVWFDEPRKSNTCPECGLTPKSRFARGDARRLPIRHRK